MTEKVRMPADLDQVTLKLLGKFDTKDLLRLTAAPTAAIIHLYQTPNPSTTVYGLLGLAVVLGGVWTLWKPWGRPLDQTLYHAVRWKTQKNIDTTPDVDNALLTTQNSATALIEVEPVNLELKSGTKKAAFHRLYQELLHTIDYRLELYTKQKPLNITTYLDNLDGSDDLQSSYRDHCKSLSRGNQNQTRHLIAVHVDNGDRAELERRVEEILEHLNASGLTAQQVTNPETGGKPPELEPGHVHRPNAENKSFSKTVYVSKYPRDIDFSWVTDILQIEGLIDITQVIEPKKSAEIASQLQKLENKAEAENASLVRKGYGSSRRLERLLDDVDWFQNLLADQNDQPVQYGVYITAHGQTLESCEGTLRKVENRLKTLGIQYHETGFRTDQTYHATTPGYPDKLNEHLLVPAGSAAAGFPFTSPTAVDSNGVLFGTNHSNGTPIILDRFKWSAGHTIIAGVTGSGKSFHSKLLLLRSAQIYDNLQINIVDPKPEYQEIAHKLSKYASVERFAPQGSITDTEYLIDAVEQAYQDAQQTAAKTIVVVDEAHRLLKTENGASILSTLIREARSTNTAVTLITQTVSDFYRSEDGEDILKNTPCKILFAHEQTDDRPEDAFNLSSIAETRLYNLTRGDTDTADHSQAILNVSNNLESRIKIHASPEEKQLIEKGEITDTNPNSANHSPSQGDAIKQRQSTKTSWIEATKNAILVANSHLEKQGLPDLKAKFGKSELPDLEKQRTNLTGVKNSATTKFRQINNILEENPETLSQTVQIPEIDIDDWATKLSDIGIAPFAGFGFILGYILGYLLNLLSVAEIVRIILMTLIVPASLAAPFILYDAVQARQKEKQ